MNWIHNLTTRSKLLLGFGVMLLLLVAAVATAIWSLREIEQAQSVLMERDVALLDDVSVMLRIWPRRLSESREKERASAPTSSRRSRSRRSAERSPVARRSAAPAMRRRGSAMERLRMPARTSPKANAIAPLTSMVERALAEICCMRAAERCARSSAAA